MRNLIVLLCFGLISTGVLSCRKDAATKAKADLQGSWELTSSAGDMPGIATYPAGNGNIVKFTGNTYFRYAADTLQSSGTFTVGTGELIMPDAALTGRLYFDNGTHGTYDFVITNAGSLIIDFGRAYDGPLNTYKRK